METGETIRETIVDVLRRRAGRQGERVAFVHLEDGEHRRSSLTYAELDRRARALAMHLSESGAAGERALLLHPQGLEYVIGFLGCLYAGVVAVPLFPPESPRLLARLRAVARDASPVLALVSSRQLEELRAPAVPELAGLRLVVTDEVVTAELDAGAAEAWRPPPGLAPSSLAFLQYTSGSTATPRGVMVTHGNLTHNALALQSSWELGESSVVVSWLPLFHDMGLIGTALQAAFVGGRCILMSPVQFLQRPARWLEAITRHGATMSGGPNFAYDLCVEKISEAEKETLDLSSWSVAFNGAEPLRSATLARFHAAFAPCGFRREAMTPGYGLAEATMAVSTGRKAAPPVTLAVHAAALAGHRVQEAEAPDGDARVLVGSGRAVREIEIAIVRPEERVPAAAGEVGEIWVAGPSVAAGYWRAEEVSADVFHAPLGGRAFLRTGDLGFLRDGELFVTGRLKDLIHCHGRNVYPQDIEWTVESSHPAVRAGGSAAFSIEVEADGDGVKGVAVEHVVVAAEVQRSFDAAAAPAVLDALRRAVAREHELGLHAAVLLRPGVLPKTTSGKVQRGACRAAYLAGQLDVVAASGPRTERPTAEPRTRAEKALAAIWSELLGAGPVGIHDNFFELGGDSILAVQVAVAARRLGLALVPRHLFEHPTIAELAALAEDAGPQASRHSGPAPERTLDPADFPDVTLDPLALARIADAVRRGRKGARR